MMWSQLELRDLRLCISISKWICEYQLDVPGAIRFHEGMQLFSEFSDYWTEKPSSTVQSIFLCAYTCLIHERACQTSAHFYYSELSLWRTLGKASLELCIVYCEHTVSHWCTKRSAVKALKNPCYIILHSQLALSPCAAVSMFQKMPPSISVRMGLNLQHANTKAVSLLEAQ